MMSQQISILIVEDEHIVAIDLQQTLRELGYDAFAIASSAEEAIRACAARCPDVVLMDIRIKGKLDGIETAELLAKRFQIALLYLTAHSDDSTLERAKKTSPHGYLLKPVRSNELRSAIEVAYYKHRKEQQAKEHAQWNAATLRSIGDAVIAVGLSGEVTFLNPIAEELIGMKAEQAIGRPSSEVLCLLDTEEDPLSMALSSNALVEIVEANLKNARTGVSRVVSDSAAPVVLHEKTLGAVMVFRDITEKKRTQQRLELSDRLSSLGTMAAGISHEINNPLAASTGNTEYVYSELERLQEIIPETYQPAMREILLALQDVKLANDRITRIVSDLSAFSSPSEPKHGTTDTNRCVELALKTTSHELRHRATVSTSLQQLPPVAAEEPRLIQVLVNLLLNAGQAMRYESREQNRINISTSLSGNGWVALEIEDNGAGMSKEIQKRIFDPFFTTKDIGSGAGLGLSICHGIVASFGGEISVRSEPGVGSIFRVSLPVAKPEKNKAPEEPTSSETKSRRVLVIDDDPNICKLFLRILKDHSVTTIGRVSEALALITRGESFDVIFCDLVMPELNGAAFYERLLRTAPSSAKKVVFISGGVISPELRNLIATVSNPLIEKPFRGKQLHQAIAEVCGP